MSQKPPEPSELHDDQLVAMALVVTVLNLSLLALDDETTRPVGVGAAAGRSFVPLDLGRGDGRSTLQARLLRSPANRDQRLPLIVFLHGSGERGSDNLNQLRGVPQMLIAPEWIKRYRCHILVPQCPRDGSWGVVMPELESLIEEVAQDDVVDSARIYLVGFSMGAYGAWQLAARRPDLFAAVVPICGGGDPDWAESLAAVPIWAVHGADDEVVPPEQSREMVEATRTAGGTPCYSELPGIGHSCWTHALDFKSGVLDWMFAQRMEAGERGSLISSQ